MREQANRKSYALSFVSFLLREPKIISRINRIILYGSVAREASTKESDIDIFIDVQKETKKTKTELEKVLERFYKSKEAVISKLLGIENEIKLKTGKLDEWKELKRSILTDGIVLWSKFESGKPEDTEHNIIFYWSRIEKNRGAFLNKIYGYRTGGKAYIGLLEQVKGTKLGKSCVMIPIAHRDKMIELLKKYKVDAKAVEVFT